MLNRTPIKKRRSKTRRGPLRDAKYRRWLTAERCAVSQNLLTGRFCDPMCDAAHTENNGMASKGPDFSCAPLCRSHHAEYDAGREAFETKYGIDMKKVAAEHWARYQTVSAQ
jgi:hypothetical protein